MLPIKAQSVQQPEMKVHFINVGQGDSMLIETPSGKNILIDGGPPEAGKKAVAYLSKHHIKKIDLLVATHPDIDHIGGLIPVLKKVKVEKVLDSGKLYTTKTYARYMKEINKQKIPVQAAKENQLINIDKRMKMRVLNSYSGKKNNNESSIALKISFKDIDFLLMGDVEKEQEKKILNKYNLKADIVKIAHHGSKTSSSLDFLKEVEPRVAILTYSKANHYGHPVDRVIKNLNRINAHIYSTAVFGDIVIRTDGEKYYIFPDRSPIDGLLEKAG
jgi:beta-lactamase superfamily II metal-dependent hydrolase